MACLRSYPERGLRGAWLAHAAAWTVLLAAPSLGADEYSPEHPDVQAAVRKALEGLPRVQSVRPGSFAMRGLAYLKFYGVPNHPEIVKALKGMRPFLDELKSPAKLVLNPGVTQAILWDKIAYDIAVCSIFLIELDPNAHRDDIEWLLKRLVEIQKDHGGWGYYRQETGDTSMTQYAILSLWEATRAGFRLPKGVWERAAAYLLRTQDPSGQWPYQGKPSSGSGLEKQDELRLSMTVAALGSLYVCLDASQAKVADGPPLPEAFQAVGLQAGATPPPELSRERLLAAIDRGEKWLFENFQRPPTEFEQVYYYQYSIERYASFRAHVRGKDDLPLVWYDPGVRRLLAEQVQPGGTWRDFTTEVPATAFAVLFMLRSTRKTIDAAPRLLGGGLLVGGRGLPGDEGEVRLVQGRVRAKPLQGPGESLLNLLDDPTNSQFQAAREGVIQLANEADEATLAQHAVRFRKLMSQPDPELRAAAVRALGRGRKLDSVPLLITALSDPVPEVAAAAETSLRFLRRQLGGGPFAGFASEEERAAAILRWRAWYLSVRPEAAGELGDSP